MYVRKSKKDHIKNFNFDTSEPDQGELYFEHLVDNIEESLTSEKVKKAIDNTFLEFLGDGVFSLLLNWDLVLQKRYVDVIDSDRIEKTNKKELFLRCQSSEIYSLDFRKSLKKFQNKKGENLPEVGFPSEEAFL